MLITNEQRQIIEDRFNQLRLHDEAKNRLYALLEECNEDERICMKYLYAFMSDEDLASYDETLFIKFVRQALKVREIAPWGSKIDGAMFLNYVLQHRINNENIEFYREDFFNEIFSRIKDLDLYEAAIEVNYWCFEKATYQSTDIRTASPLTVLKNAYGRCGEESTLGVAALRSVGIPARQVYAPRWAHCDDNHAWVEVWTGSEWHFLGACEPEPILDTGWFILPASKGMLVHSQAFSTFTTDEEVVFKTARHTEVNCSKHYAKTQEVTVQIKDVKGEVVEGANVRFEIINYSELFPITELITDANGEVKFLTGFGDIIIYVHKEGITNWKQLDVRLQDRLEITLPDAPVKEVDTQYLTLVPAEGYMEEGHQLTDEQKESHETRNTKALAGREAFKATFYVGEKAKALAAAYAPFEAEVQECLEKSLGNYSEIINFFQDEETKDYLEYKVKLLSTLSKKDHTDITCELLKSHLVEAMKWQGDYSDEIFVPYVLSPRVAFEMIVPYRQAICEKLGQTLCESFKADPNKVYEYIQNEIEKSPETNYSIIYSSVIGMLDLKRGNAISREVLFVAICRALGVPARLNQQDHSLSYYQEGTWLEAGSQNGASTRTGTLVLTKESTDLDFDYMRTYTIGKLENGVYTTLELEGIAWEGESISYQVRPGHYRVITSNRQADGTILARFYYMDVVDGGVSKLVIGLTMESQDGANLTVTDREVTSLANECCMLSSLLEDKHNMIAYLDVAAEPTEHLLNEIIESQEKFNNLKPNIIFILDKPEDMQNATLQKALNAVPHIQVYYGFDKEELEEVYQGFQIPDRKLPLAYVMNDPMIASYAWAGYNVGIGEMLLKYLFTK